MTFSRWARRCAAGILLGVGLCGCLPDAGGPADEEREPHFLTGKKLVDQMDYEGAVNAYEKAVEVNPQSAAAHFELAWLYEGKENDPAAAIYHYERFLKLAPNSGRAEVARAHINNCKLTLAETASAIAPISASAQRDLERLMQENKELKAELAYYQSHIQTPASNPPVQGVLSNVAVSLPVTGTNRAQTKTNVAIISSLSSAPTTLVVRTHTVKPGDTLMAVSRKYGVSLAALEAANPRVKPAQLQVGAVLNLPPP